MIRKDELPALVKNLGRVADEGLGFTLRFSPAEGGKDEMFQTDPSWSVSLRKGDFLSPRMEVVGRSAKSFSEALDNALRELDGAGQIGARLEPAAQTDEEIPF